MTAAPTPFFIVGAERSGTTMFRLMLDHHPEIAVCSEFEYAVDALVGCDAWPELASFHAALRANWIFQDHGFSIDATLSYPQLIASFLQQTHARGGRLVGAVVHRHFDQLARIWPVARYVHIVRDPRDVARSVVKMGWAGNVWHGVERWVAVETTWEQMRSSLSADCIFELHYEALVRDPEAVLGKVCEFLGVAYSPAMLTYSRHTAYDVPDPTLVEQWPRQLSPREVAWVEAQAGALMAARGYTLHAARGDYPSRAAQRYLGVDDRVRRMRFRQRRLGYTLWLSDMLSRRLRIAPWQRRLDPQLRTIWKQHLK